MEEFASKGYDRASTNAIIKKAGISKGAIFQYFMNKELMFYYIFDHAEKQIKDYILDNIDLNSPDLLIRVQSYMDSMLNLLTDFPRTMEFILKARSDDNIGIKSEILKRESDSYNKLEEVFKTGLDIELFKSPKELDKIIIILKSTLDKLLEDGLNSSLDKSEIYDTICDYISYFRKLFYI